MRKRQQPQPLDDLMDFTFDYSKLKQILAQFQREIQQLDDKIQRNSQIQSDIESMDLKSLQQEIVECRLEMAKNSQQFVRCNQEQLNSLSSRFIAVEEKLLEGRQDFNQFKNNQNNKNQKLDQQIVQTNKALMEQLVQGLQKKEKQEEEKIQQIDNQMSQISQATGDIIQVLSNTVGDVYLQQIKEKYPSIHIENTYETKYDKEQLSLFALDERIRALEQQTYKQQVEQVDESDLVAEFQQDYLSPSQIQLISNGTKDEIKQDVLIQIQGDIIHQVSLQSVQQFNELKQLVESKADQSEVEQINQRIKQLQQLNSLQIKINENMKSIDESRGRISQIEYTLQNQEPPQIIQQITNEVDLTPFQIKIEQIQEQIDRTIKNVAQKVSRSELEQLFRNARLAQTQEVYGIDEDVPSKLKEFESRLNNLWRDYKESEESTNAKQQETVDTINQTLEKSQQMLENQIIQNRLDFNQKLRSFHDEIFQPMNENEIKNLQVLRQQLVLQGRDVQDQISRLDQIESTVKELSFSISLDYQSEKDDNLPQMSQVKRMGNVIRKHEANIQQLKQVISKLTADFEQSQLSIKQNNDQQQAEYVKSLENVQGSIQDIMNKIYEGAKLNKRDMQKVSELYQIIEGKSDRSDILQKVDKQELKSAYRLLSRKINSLQSGIKKSEQEKLLQRNPDDPTIFKQNTDDYECLACGNKVSKQIKLKQGKIQSQMQIGPGFSKILQRIGEENNKSPDIPRKKQFPRVSKHSQSVSNLRFPSVERSKPTQQFIQGYQFVVKQFQDS